MNASLVFQCETPSHEWWVRLVDQFPNLDFYQIMKFMENTYGTKFVVGADSWTLEFPDQDTLTQFLLAWS
jgi:hypothetical protein